MRSKRLSPSRAAVVVLAAVLVAVVAITPSLAGSFLTRQQATKLFVSQKKAKGSYLTKKDAAARYLSAGRAASTYQPSATTPSVATKGSTVVFGPVSAPTTAPVDVPASSTKIKVKETGLAVLTFSGVSECKAATDGVPCNVQLIVDGSPAGSTGKVPFDTSSSAKPSAHSFTQTTVLTPGRHAIWAQYAGSSDPSVTFKLQSWDLVVQSYPGT
jgi:hypothetical protein